MSDGIASRLAHAMERRDEEPNVGLAEELVREKNRDGIAQLINLAVSGRRPAQNDAIKVLYEVGARNADLLRPHTQSLLQLIHSRNNRMVWGALTALAQIARVDADPIAARLDEITAAADANSVIARDQLVQILIALAARPDMANDAKRRLFARLHTAAINQLPMYAEQTYAVLNPAEYAEFRAILSHRLAGDLPASKRRRIEKVARKLA
ncbi:MAG: hypothetical protein NXI27_18330 [Alphaproteobacteria bacterium]|nr:hypothetical protein [Alphaproteobacteria bacterium]